MFCVEETFFDGPIFIIFLGKEERRIMKTKKKVLIGLMAACLLGTIGSVFALTRNVATTSGTAGQADKAIYLYWGEGSSTATINNVQNLTTAEPAYRYLEVSPKSSKTLTGTVTVTFTLAAEDASHYVDGLTVSVYKLDAAIANPGTATASDFTTAIGATAATPVLTSANLSGTSTVAVTTSGGVAHYSHAYYAIKIAFDGTSIAGKTMGGQVTIAQSFAAGA